jgi:hypothetical protein
MSRRCLSVLFGAVVGLGLWLGNTSPARAADENLDRYFYYPYYYFPHNYWPSQGPQWPEKPGNPYMRPPAYMAFPPFKENNWRYDLWAPHLYHSGFHFWLDQF